MIQHADFGWLIWVVIVGFSMYSQYKKAKRVEEETKKKRQAQQQQNTADKYVAPRPTAFGNDQTVLSKKANESAAGKTVKEQKKIFTQKQTQTQVEINPAVQRTTNDASSNSNPYKIETTTVAAKEYVEESAITNASLADSLVQHEAVKDFDLRKALIAQVILERPQF